MEQKGECSTQEEVNSSSIAEALTVPIPILISRFRNQREVKLVMDASNFAVIFDSVLDKYEMVSVRAQALQEAWNSLWISQHPLLVSAIPLIGEKMSESNRIRTHLLRNIDAIIGNFQIVANGLLQYAEINLSVAEELRIEGIDRLATDKQFLSELEQELAKRINAVCTKGSSHKLSGNMSDFIQSLMMRLAPSDHRLHDGTTEKPGCNPLNQTVGPGQDIDLINTSIHWHDKLIVKDSVSPCDSRALLGPNYQERTSAEHDKVLTRYMALTTTAMATCLLSGGLAQNEMNIISQNNCSSASEERLPDLGSNAGLLQKCITNKNNVVDIGDKHLHACNSNDAVNSMVETSQTV